jgi:ribulose 1,5-bisphosphate carboxylase large subunit-like protein
MMSTLGDFLRDDLARQRQNRHAKLARIFARPGQLTKSGSQITVHPRGEDPGDRIVREAREAATAARAAADAAKR